MSTTQPYVLAEMYEQPRKSLMVNLIIDLFIRFKKRRYSSPHSQRVDSAENQGQARTAQDDQSLDPVLDQRTQYEYDTAYNSFFWWLTDHVTMDVLDHKDVLDVGCGWGGKMIHYAENTQLNTIHGLDIPPYDPEVSEAFARSKGLDNCFFTAAYAEDIPYEDNRFEVVIIDDVLEHVQDPVKTVSEVYRVLKPGGTLIMKSPSFKMLDAHHLDNAITLPRHPLFALDEDMGGGPEPFAFRRKIQGHAELLPLLQDHPDAVSQMCHGEPERAGLRRFRGDIRGTRFRGSDDGDDQAACGGEKGASLEVLPQRSHLSYSDRERVRFAVCSIHR